MAKRMLISLCLTLVLCVGFLPARAYGTDVVHTSGFIPIEPLWAHTISIAATMEINNGRALMTGSVIGRPGTERISVNARLDRVNANGSLTHIVSWNNVQATGSVWTWERSHGVATGVSTIKT
ncbi:MAG: hypothetical protein FWB96_13080 [Defluviitaleaceae bacterium]|nr:hypothetical protein [Defluviitaleaceae bacterium]MCL2264136.1 hypothetical protein [Defluviitaleaceae bacterium]